MTKPDDIPQDVWDASNVRCDPDPASTLRTAIARAIMAEREACALLAGRWGRKRIENHRQTGMSAELVEGTLNNLAAAIRNRGAA